MTERIENDNETHVTQSDLSEWAGPEVINFDYKAPAARQLGDQAEHDVFDWTSRLLDFTPEDRLGLPLGPTNPTSFFSWPIFLKMREFPLFRDLLSKFFGFTYDSVDVTITVSDPKGLVGGYMCGWIPYLDYFDKGPNQTMQVWHSTIPLVSTLYNHPNTQMGCFGNSQDIKFSIPWTFKQALYPSSFVTKEDQTTQQGRPPPGTPIIWFDRMTSNYVTGTPMPARLKVFAKFNGLKWYGPCTMNLTFDAQSGVQAFAAAALTTVAATGIAAVTDKIIGTFQSKVYSVQTGDASQDTFDKPQAVQMAFVGDTTSTGPPIVEPIFIPPRLDDITMPTVLDMLKRPQYLGTMSTSSNEVLLNNCPGLFGVEGGKWTFFRYFSMINRFWRGTIKFHFIIAGHPLIEVRASLRVEYPGNLDVPDTDVRVFTENTTHFSVGSGSREIVVPMPFVTSLDYVPIRDNLANYTAELRCKFDVISTMLNVVPEIPVYIFVSAGDDFAYYMPYTPGFYNVDAQVGLPDLGEPEIVNTRFRYTDDPGTMPAFNELMDYMRIWSRCIPFSDYDNDVDEEPIPDPVPGCVCAAWFPPIDRAEDMPANNSWYFTNDFVSYLSMLFVHYKGSIGLKVVASKKHRPQDGFMYVALGDTYLDQRVKTHCPFPYDETELPSNSNFGNGAVVTPVSQQPVLEFTIPYRGINALSYTNYCLYNRGLGGANNARVQTNIVLQNPEDDYLADAMYRKAGSDFYLCVEAGLPPPAMWYQRGWVV